MHGTHAGTMDGSLYSVARDKWSLAVQRGVQKNWKIFLTQHYFAEPITWRATLAPSLDLRRIESFSTERGIPCLSTKQQHHKNCGTYDNFLLLLYKKWKPRNYPFLPHVSVSVPASAHEFAINDA